MWTDFTFPKSWILLHPSVHPFIRQLEYKQLLWRFNQITLGGVQPFIVQVNSNEKDERQDVEPFIANLH